MAPIALGKVPRLQAERRGPDHWALRHGDEIVTWAELDSRSTRRAWALQDQGVVADDFVTLSLRNGAAFYEMAFALWKLGATPHIVSPRLPEAELRAILKIARPRLIVAADLDLQRGLNARPATFGLAEGHDTPLPEKVSRRWKAMSSGGSTGRPKIIVTPQPGVLDPEVAYLRIPTDQVILNPGPLYHNAPMTGTIHALARGDSIVGMTRFDAEEALRLIDRFKVAWVNFVPTMLSRIWNLPKATRDRYDISSLETIWHMASPMPPGLKRAWLDWVGPQKMWELYGSTEGIGATHIRGDDWLAHPGSVGRAQASSIRILDEAGEELPRGEVGEIFLRPDTGPGSTYSYLGAEPRMMHDGYESIGDYGRMDAQGYLYLADRRTDMFISGGANIFPAEIETTLVDHPGVEDAVVIGLPHSDLGAAGHAIVKPAEGWTERLQDEDLAAFVNARLARYKTPRTWEITTNSLRDDAGKIRRLQLRQERLT
jgi:bile acid-coenzyme A ligase